MPFKSKEHQAAVMIMLGGMKHKVKLRFNHARGDSFYASAHIKPRSVSAAQDLHSLYADPYAADNLDFDKAEVGRVQTEVMPSKTSDYYHRRYETTAGGRRVRVLPFVTGSYLLPELRGKGLGRQMYVELAKYIAQNSQYPGVASIRDQRNRDSNALWRRFKSKGRYGIHDVLPGKPYKKKGTR